MPQVVHIRRDPFGFVEEPLGHGGIHLGQVLDDGWSEGEAKPGHGRLPAQPESAGHVLARKPFAAGEGLFQACL